MLRTYIYVFISIFWRCILETYQTGKQESLTFKQELTGEKILQTYVVRIYRRDSDNTNEVAGIIEKIDTRQQHSFVDLSELQDTLVQFIKSDDAETGLFDVCARPAGKLI